jgi:DNA-binding transcriptional MerR regulator
MGFVFLAAILAFIVTWIWENIFIVLPVVAIVGFLYYLISKKVKEAAVRNCPNKDILDVIRQNLDHKDYSPADKKRMTRIIEFYTNRDLSIEQRQELKDLAKNMCELSANTQRTSNYEAAKHTSSKYQKLLALNERYRNQFKKKPRLQKIDVKE